MDKIRLATPAEIEHIKLKSDLDPRVPCTIVAFENGAAGADLAVIKTAVELDPVFFQPGTSDKRKALFVWGITNALRIQGIPAVYFNVDSADGAWQRNIENFGGERVSPVPEYRYRLELTKLETPNGHEEND